MSNIFFSLKKKVVQSNCDPRADGPNLVDPTIDQAVNYLAPLIGAQSSIRVQIEHGMGLKIKFLNVGPKQAQVSPNRAHNGHISRPMSALLYFALHAQKVGPLAHIKRDTQ